jgi:hypothetical protein
VQYQHDIATVTPLGLLHNEEFIVDDSPTTTLTKSDSANGALTGPAK